MAILLDHTIVPARDKLASAKFFAEVFGLNVQPGDGYFAQVQVNDSLTFDFADETEPQSHHYAFHISDTEFEGAVAGAAEDEDDAEAGEAEEEHDRTRGTTHGADRQPGEEEHHGGTDDQPDQGLGGEDHLKGNGGEQRFLQAGRKSVEECKDIRDAATLTPEDRWAF